jgi:hypothetical protein
MNISACKKHKPDWETIQENIIAKLNETIADLKHTVETTNSTSETTYYSGTSSNTGSGSSSIKPKLLTPNDKAKIIEIYNNLDQDKMWVLSSNTIVENEMKKYALACNYEQ